MKRFGFVVACLGLAAPAWAQDRVEITVTLDPAALAEMQKRDEGMTIAGWLFGDPAPGNTLELDDLGSVWLGSEEITIRAQADQTVTLGNSLAAAPVSAVVAPMLNVNVYSARFTDDNNLLDCDLVEGPVADLAKSPQVITCKLIGG